MIQGIHSLTSIPTIRFVLKIAQKTITLNDNRLFREFNAFALDQLKEIVLNHVANRDESIFDEEVLLAEVLTKGEITSLEWAELCKQLIRKGKFWQPTLHLSASRQLLFSEWKKDLQNPKAQQLAFLNFLGQLCKDGKEVVVDIFHQYLSILRKTNLYVLQAKGDDYKGVNDRGLAKITGPIFFDAMDFSLCIFEQTATEHYTNAHRNESMLLAEIAYQLFNNDIFDSAFSKKLYRKYRQNPDELQKFEQIVEESLFNSPTIVHAMAKVISQRLENEPLIHETKSAITSSTSEESLAKTPRKSKKTLSDFLHFSKKDKSDQKITPILELPETTSEIKPADEDGAPPITLMYNLKLDDVDHQPNEDVRLHAPRGRRSPRPGVQVIFNSEEGGA